jgi:hypothetical protein
MVFIFASAVVTSAALLPVLCSLGDISPSKDTRKVPSHSSSGLSTQLHTSVCLVCGERKEDEEKITNCYIIYR